MRNLITDTVILQLLQVRDLYDCDLYNVTLVREYAYRDGLVELYNLVSNHPDKYYLVICNGYGIDL